MPRNLIIDGQILQTDAWHRGMGKYTLQVLRGLSEESTPKIKLSIVFNSTIKCDPSRFETIKFLCPNFRQIQYQLPVPVDDATNAEKEEGADEYRTVLKACLDEDFAGQDNCYLMTSLFFFDFFAEFPADYYRLLLFYDLTPFLFWHDLGGYFPPNLYMRRFERLLEAEIVFSISQTTRYDLIEALGLDPSRVININGGFTKVSEKPKKPTSFKIPARYILFPTGDLPHKNNKAAVEGFEMYYQGSNDPVPLLVTSRFQNQSKKSLKGLSKHIIFTENVSDEELEWLYENAAAVLFASKYEGLGLPILDAVANQKPIIASKIPVFEEMSKEAFYYFKVNDSKNLAETISKATRTKNFSRMTTHYPSILEKYTWQNTCNLLLKGMEGVKPGPGSEKKPEPINTKPRVAVACIHPGLKGQIGRRAEALHNSLSQLFEVDYYFDANGSHYRDMERPTFLDYFLNKPYDIIKLDKYTYSQYATVIYLLDENSVPSRIAQRAVALPGIAVVGFHNKESNRQNRMFRDIVLRKQRHIHELDGNSYDAYQTLAKALYNDVL